MTPREEIVARLVNMNGQIRSLAVLMDDAAAVAQVNGASGVAFSCLMLKDALLAYCRSVNDYASDVLTEDDLDT